MDLVGGEEDRGSKDYMDATDRSIDELLATLGGLEGIDEEEDEEEAVDGSVSDDGDVDDESGGDLDSNVSQMVDELQEWRAKNEKLPFEDWDSANKKEFNKWLSKYIDLVTPNSNDNNNNRSNHKVDLHATRDALLSEPPRTREQSDTFWSRVQDETEAEILLDHLTSNPPTTNTTTSSDTSSAAETKSRLAYEAFLQMPHDQQLRHLINLGTLRPILDEYASESDRLKFMERYGGILLEGVELEHLVSDPNGTITAGDIGDEALLQLDGTGGGSEDGGGKKVGKDARFSIEMISYGTDEFGRKRSERARALYRAWNEQKAGRAKYEEFLYKSGKIPLEVGSGGRGGTKK